MTSATVKRASIGGRACAWARVVACGLSAALTMLVMPAMAQQNAIEAVTAVQSGAATVLKIELRAAPKGVPPSFSIANPSRIALDFADTGNNSGKTSHDISQGDLRSVNIVTVGDRSRLVLNLKRNVPYTTTVEGNSVLISMDPSPATADASATVESKPVRFAESTGAGGIRNIDFRRGRDGEGRVVVDLTDSRTGVDIRQQGQTVVVEFLKTSLPANLRRRLDVTDFGTPVQFVNTTQQGETVRMVIEPKGLWEHNAYQSDTQFVVEVKPIKEDPNRLIQSTQLGYKGDKLSLNFQNIEVRAVLQVIADFTNLNIITSETVTGNLTLRLRDVPWDQALDIVLQAKGLDMRKNGNVIWVAPRDELAAKEKLDLESRQAISELEPLRTESFQLNYQKAEDVQKIIDNDKQKVISKRGSVVADKRTNQIFVTDTASKLEDIRRLIQQIDVATRQVLIEARIVEATDGFSRTLGVRLGGSGGVPREVGGSGVYGTITGGSVGLNGTITQTNPIMGTLPPNSVTDTQGPTITSVTQNGFSIGSTDFLNIPASSLNGYNAGSLAVTLFNSSLSRFINLELSALEADGKGRIVSSPRVITADQVNATIEDGEEIPYEQASSSGATNIAFRKAVLKLDVTPQITPEGSIILTVNVNKDSRGTETRAGPAINTKNVKTQVLVENGGTVVIGGIYTITERNDVTKIPLLGDIPFIGGLFRNQSRVNNKAELLIFLTPRIVSNTSFVAR